MDVLSEVLRVIRLKGALFLNAEFREPWCVVAPSSADMAAVLAPGEPPAPMAICHLVVEGRCWARLNEGEAVTLGAGDVVTFPMGDPHLVGAGPDGGPPSARDAVQLRLPELARVRYGGQGATTVVVCGWFAYEPHVAHAVMAALPRMFRTALRARPVGAWIEGSVRYAVQEAGSGRPGAAAVSDRLAELLFVEALRGCLESLPPEQRGWLAGLRDPLVGKSITLLHERPGEAWTVAGLARAVNASRTVLAERFAALVGVPPMQYLTQWRILLAAHLLRHERLSLGRIAEQVGYESEAAFSRAFKRRYGAPPGEWRRDAKRQPAAQAPLRHLGSA